MNAFLSTCVLQLLRFFATIVKVFPYEHHGKSIELAVAEEGLFQCLAHLGVTELQLSVGCQCCTAIGYSIVVLSLHLVKFLLWDVKICGH